ncbi:hypothetical protein BD414DRAFT_492035 [Trametes punicea]|nr:hypothetical protein BD414DRAFT_492035 [Trametes punicea]
MHVLKKNITPKLSAKRAKAEHGGHDDGYLREGRQAQPARTRSTHRRTRSSDPSSPPPWSGTRDGDCDGHLKKARPASVSAVVPHHSTPSTAEVQELGGRTSNERSETTTATTGTITASRISRQIISSEELAQIIARFPDTTVPTMRTQHSLGLSPPSYYRHRRVPPQRPRGDELGMVMS